MRMVPAPKVSARELRRQLDQAVSRDRVQEIIDNIDQRLLNIEGWLVASSKPGWGGFWGRLRWLVLGR